MKHIRMETTNLVKDFVAEMLIGFIALWCAGYAMTLYFKKVDAEDPTEQDEYARKKEK